MVNSRRSAIIGAAIWLGAVVGVSATSWVAIDRAGRDITEASSSTLPLLARSTPTPQATTATPTPPVTPGPTAAPEPTARATSASVTPPWTLAPSVTPPPSTKPLPTATPKPTATPAPTSRSRTFSVRGGQITVSCTGASIRLQDAQPENEWRVRVDPPEAGRIEVTFRKSEEEEDETHQTKVTAVCTSGTPTFRVSTS